MEINQYANFKTLALERHLCSPKGFKTIEDLLNVETIKYLYPKGLFKDSSFKLQLVTISDENIFVLDIDSNLFAIKVLKKSQIKNIEIFKISEYHYKLTIDFNSGYQIVLSNVNDTNDDWSETFLEYIKDVFKLLL